MVALNPEVQDRFLSFDEARAFLGNVAKQTLREWTSKRRIPCYKPGKRVMYLLSDLMKFMKLHKRSSLEQLDEQLAQKRREL